MDKTTLRISEDIIKQLKHIAIDENKTLTQIIQEALNEYLNRKRSKDID
ncbi:MAG TPA: ribbon-helix-helix domain-containing protein [Nitrososphaeraceae archaeon]